ncbi:MAG: hypothetical protein RQ723_08380 [Desulfuromonadales bacterium]|nr:hypothetical protein [Desulfuromonadales bacterium]
MTIERRWFCTCSGTPVELSVVETSEDEPGEPTCQRCGASVSSDPKKTVIFKDVESWED